MLRIALFVSVNLNIIIIIIMKPNFMSRHTYLDIKSREFSCATFPRANSKERICQLALFHDKVFSKTNHLCQIIIFSKFSEKIQKSEKIQYMCFYYRAYRLREETGTTRLVLAFLFYFNSVVCIRVCFSATLTDLTLLF